MMMSCDSGDDDEGDGDYAIWATFILSVALLIHVPCSVVLRCKLDVCRLRTKLMTLVTV